MSFAKSLDFFATMDTSQESGTSIHSGRKSAKEGVDIERARRLREDKLNQIRKNRRNEKTTIQRRRFVENEGATFEICESDIVLEHQQQPDETAQDLLGIQQKQTMTKSTAIRNLDDLPEKLTELMSDLYKSQHDGIVYFRRILAIDRNPPIEIVIQAGIVPRLIEFLQLHMDSNLQFEAAWCVTNIVCGEFRFVKVLLDHNILANLINLIAYSTDEKVRSQALWALSNISSDVDNCRDLIIAAGALTPLLWQLGINQPPERAPLASPSLGAMQHLAFIFCNLSKGTGNIPSDSLSAIVFALSVLLQSPDEIVYHVVACSICYMCEKNDDYIQVILENGIISRMHALLNDPKASEICTRTFVTLMGSSNELHVRLVCSSKYPGVMDAMLKHVMDVLEKNENKVLHRIDLCCEIFLTLGRIMDLDKKYCSKLCNIKLVEVLRCALDKNKHDLSIQAGVCLCTLVTNADTDHILSLCFASLSYFVPFLSSDTCPELIHMGLHALRRLLEWAQNSSANGAWDSNETAHLKESLYFLADHPILEINQLAESVETLLEIVDHE